MRKRLIGSDDEAAEAGAAAWLDLPSLAEVEVTSEDPQHPIDAALTPGQSRGWRASAPGRQVIRLLFDEPRSIATIELTFREEETARTQEFHLSWAETAAGPFSDILRQQFHFSPPGTMVERERYTVNLTRVKALELRIIPEVSGTSARASLESWRVA